MKAVAAYRVLPVLLCILLLAGCGGIGHHGPHIGRTPQVTGVQACAIGYDLAQQIYQRVSLRRTVILAPHRATGCETHALEYLRRAGFRIDETGQGGARFNIGLSRLDPEIISAVAWIGDDLRIARSYRPARTGVIAAGPVSVQHLEPDTYAPRDTGRPGS